MISIFGLMAAYRMGKRAKTRPSILSYAGLGILAVAFVASLRFTERLREESVLASTPCTSLPSWTAGSTAPFHWPVALLAGVVFFLGLLALVQAGRTRARGGKSILPGLIVAAVLLPFALGMGVAAGATMAPASACSFVGPSFP